jgi:hypothetical protein
MNTVQIEPYNTEEPQAPNAYIVRVEGEHGTITSWRSTITEAVEEARRAVDLCNDPNYWERYA